MGGAGGESMGKGCGPLSEKGNQVGREFGLVGIALKLPKRAQRMMGGRHQGEEVDP